MRQDENNKENLEALHTTEKPEDTLKDKRIRERDFCFYCETFILNFSRHMTRNHSAEPEVQKALSYPKNSTERKKH